MRVGGTHSWCYRQGEWEETKVTPDKWQFSFAVNKRRKWDAPEGSGAPTGTEYHWYILAHQNVRKLNANEYTTSMTGVKYKLAHRRAGNEEWSASGRSQLRRLIAILEENLSQLSHELGEADSSPVAVKQQRKQMICSRRMPPEGTALGMIGQPPLEVYIPQTKTAAANVGTPARIGSGWSASSKSEFFPKNSK